MDISHRINDQFEPGLRDEIAAKAKLARINAGDAVLDAGEKVKAIPPLLALACVFVLTSLARSCPLYRPLGIRTNREGL